MLTKSHSSLIKPQKGFCNLRKSNTTITLLQKNFCSPKPVRPYNRFMKERIAYSGLAPKDGFLEFTKGDLVQPLCHESIYTKLEPLYRKNWALDTTKQCAQEPLLPKIQQYKNYYFPQRKPGDAIAYQNSFLSSDNIGIRIPEIYHVEDKDSFLLKKSNYGSHIETRNSWEPKFSDKTISNKSSVMYNILSNDLNDNEGRFNHCDRQINHRKKGVGEFRDLSNVYKSNFNQEYQNVYNKDNHIFHNYKGVFSHMYDAAHRNGNITVPFRKGGIINQIPDKKTKVNF